MPNGIDLILADHRTVEALFDQFDETANAMLVGRVIDALKAHDDAEQAALYPLALALLDDALLIERAELAHSAVKQQIGLVAGLEGPPLVEAFAGLRALVTEHVADEEAHLIPALAARASTQQLDALGARILQAKQRVG